MKWFLFLAVLVGAYYYFLVSTTNTVLDSTQQLGRQYQSATAQADAIAAGATQGISER